jgi:hypothetical protein
MIRRLVIAGLALAMVFAVWTPVHAQQGFDLPQVLISPEGRLSIRYPAGWVVRDDFPGALMMGTSQAVLDYEVEQLEDDELFIVGYSPSYITYIAPTMFSPEFQSAETLLDAAEMVVAVWSYWTTYGEIEEAELGGHPAAITRIETDRGIGFMALIEFGDEYAMAFVTGSTDGFVDQEPLALAILDTLTYAAPEGLASITTMSGSLTLEYPAAWLAYESSPGVVHIGNQLPSLVVEEAQDFVDLAVFTEETLLIIGISVEPGDPAQTAENVFDGSYGGRNSERIARSEPVQADRAYIDFVDGDLAGYVLVREYEGGMVVIVTAAGGDALEAYAAEVDAIIESIVYTPLGEPLPADGE